MKSLLLLTLGVSCILPGNAQTLGDFKPKDQSYGLRKIKSKRVYIASFTVTDRLYKDFTAMLQQKGLEIIKADEAGKAGTYEGFTKVTGGTINEAQFPGTVATMPTGMEYYVKSIDKSGKEKSGGLFGNANFVHAKLSKDLDDAIIADVDLFVMFVEDKNSWDGAGANIKVKTNMRLAGAEVIESTKKAFIKFKGENTHTAINSQVGFYSGKMGAGIVSSYTGTLGKSMPVSDVIEDKKLQAFAASKTDYVGVSTVYGKFYNPDNTASTSTTIIPVDEKKYADGAYQAGKKFIEFHTGAFLKELE